MKVDAECVLRGIENELLLWGDSGKRKEGLEYVYNRFVSIKYWVNYVLILINMQNNKLTYLPNVFNSLHY